MAERGWKSLLMILTTAILAAGPGCLSVSGDPFAVATKKVSTSGEPDLKAPAGASPTGDLALAARGPGGLPPVPPVEPERPAEPASPKVALLFADDSSEFAEEEEDNSPVTVLCSAPDQNQGQAISAPADPKQSAATLQPPAEAHSPDTVLRDALPADHVTAQTGERNSFRSPTGGQSEPENAAVLQSPDPAEGTELFPPFTCAAADGHWPREMLKVALGPYVIEPPDILLVEVAPVSLPGGPDAIEQRISGEHLVRPDGTVGLGIYGSVRLAGLTLDEARTAIADHLKQVLKIKISPKVNVDVFAYDSKAYYVIADNAGYGQSVIRLSFNGNDTVLDAIGKIGGLPAAASKKKIWIARPGPDHKIQTLPVDWVGITQDGRIATNYQLFPGDRIYIQSDRLMALDGIVSKIVSPIERVLGVTFLGAQTIFRLQNMGRGAGGLASGGI